MATDWRKYSTTPSSNTTAPPDGAPEGMAANTVNNTMRDMMAMIKNLGDYTQGDWTDISATATCNIAATLKSSLRIVGNATISAFDNNAESGVRRLLRFASSPILTNSSVLLLPGGANITATASDCLMAVSLGSGIWKVPFYQRKDGSPVLASTGTGNLVRANSPTLVTPAIGAATATTAAADTNSTHVATTAFVLAQAASQAELEANSSTTKFVSAGRAFMHPSACKGWVKAGVTGNVLAGFNVNSVTDGGTGIATVVWETDFSSADYCAVAGVHANAAAVVARVDAVAAGTTEIRSFATNTTTLTDPTAFFCSAFGDQ